MTAFIVLVGVVAFLVAIAMALDWAARPNVINAERVRHARMRRVEQMSPYDSREQSVSCRRCGAEPSKPCSYHRTGHGPAYSCWERMKDGLAARKSA